MKKLALFAILFGVLLIPATSIADTKISLNIGADISAPVYAKPRPLVIAQNKYKHKVKNDKGDFEEEFEQGDYKSKVKRKIKPEEAEYEREFEDGNTKHKIKRKVKKDEIEYEEEFEQGGYKRTVKYKVKPDGSVEFEEKFD